MCLRQRKLNNGFAFFGARKGNIVKSSLFLDGAPCSSFGEIECRTRCRPLGLPSHLKDQLARAASSIALNLAEGRGKLTAKDQRKFFSIAMGSVRECQALLLLADLDDQHEAVLLLDYIAASTYRLIQRA